MKINYRNVDDAPDGMHSVGEGLFLLVRGNSRSWVVRKQINGKRLVRSLGTTAELSIAQAKKKAQAFKFTAPPKRSSVLFKDFYPHAIDAIAVNKQWKNEKHAYQWTQTVESYALPFIGDLPLWKITQENILELLQEIWFTKTETATRLMSRLRSIFAIAKIQGLIEQNPVNWAEHLSFFLPSKGKVAPVTHLAAASVDQLCEVSKRCIESYNVSYKAVLFGILTATRVQEFLFAQWEEVDFKNAIWTVPADRMKMGVAHVVPLPNQAIRLLTALGPLDKGFIFAKKDGQPMQIETPRMTIRRILKDKVTMHGCRSTFRDWCAESEIDDVVAEKCLAHETWSKVVRAYQRSDLLERRRPVMQAWADALLPKAE